MPLNHIVNEDRAWPAQVYSAAWPNSCPNVSPNHRTRLFRRLLSFAIHPCPIQRVFAGPAICQLRISYIQAGTLVTRYRSISDLLPCRTTLSSTSCWSKCPLVRAKSPVVEHHSSTYLFSISLGSSCDNVVRSGHVWALRQC